MVTKKKKPTKKKSAKKIAKKSLSQKKRIVLASVFLLGFVTICLFALMTFRSSFQAETDETYNHEELVYEEPEHEVQPFENYQYEDIYSLVENQLINGPDSMGWRKMPERGAVQVRKVFGDFPSTPYLTELATHIEHTKSPAMFKVSRRQGVIHLYWQNDLRLELQYQIPPVEHGSRGKIAIVMDDICASMSPVQQLLQLDIIVTPAILPGTRNDLKSTTLLQQNGREYLIHMPMQPRSYPRTNPGSNALLLGQTEAETISLIRDYIREVPGAVGGNNHMGSRYTQVAPAMRTVLRELKTQGLFFIDSRTIGDSVAFTEARKMGMETATRNIFLDNKSDVDYIRNQIRKMIKLATDNREIIAICHPHAVTLEALRLEQAWLKRQPVDFVAASEVVHSY